ncbi:MAG: Lipid-A-disaccharide synthase [Chlamydiales bacterium]|nr:Lipid-A-disaccharide synthase [Chlamydiales bacterium]MCH9620538.1 Lipid-A-disaccharide synthase [Chlamydiales bacterium]MCH9623014.1 Lipid-A-disaccharide synthase [Chlamydiales bacterium]
MSYCILSGEQSGDQLGAELIKRLDSPSFGMGGTLLEQAGCEIIEQPLHVMGITDVIKVLPKILWQLKNVQETILRRNPKVVITIDNPDFNLRIAKALRKKGYRGKLIHLVSPHVWAWRGGRVFELEKTLDHLLTILPFEKQYYEKTTLDVTYIGHPLAQKIKEHIHQPLDLPPETIALFPGSRPHEIAHNLPLQLKATEGLPIAVSLARKELTPLVTRFTTAPLIPASHRYDLMHQAKGALATSGTIVLELALHATPTVVTYRLSPLNYFLGRHIFRIHLPYYTLPNLICEREIFPEFFHTKIHTQEVRNTLEALLLNPEICKSECQRLKHLLDVENGIEKAAKVL